MHHNGLCNGRRMFNGGRWRLVTLCAISIYFIFIVKAFFASSNAPAYTLSANPKHFAHLSQFKTCDRALFPAVGNSRKVDQPNFPTS